MNKNRARRAFTLPELLTVIAVIAILAGIVLAALGPAKKMARVADCMSHLHQLGVAYHMYVEDYGRYAPFNDVHPLIPYLKDQRVLLCPDDVSVAPLGAVSSYAYNGLIVPGFRPIQSASELPPAMVLVVCRHHVGPHPFVFKTDPPPVYPYHLILRVDGRVDRIHYSKIRRVTVPDGRLSTIDIYPGEPGYEKASQ